MSFCLHLWLLYTRSTRAIFLFCAGKVKAFTVVKQPIQSKELRRKPIHFLFTNDSTTRLPFQRIECVTNMHIHYDRTWTPKSTEAQTRKDDDKQIRLCFETEDLHQDCPEIHEKYSIIIKLLSVQLEENYYGTVSARPLPICAVSVILSDAFPWSQPSSQSTKAFLRSALT